MLYGMDVCGPRDLVIAGDTRGNLHFADPRTASALGVLQAHKKGNKVCFCVHSPAEVPSSGVMW